MESRSFRFEVKSSLYLSVALSSRDSEDLSCWAKACDSDDKELEPEVSCLNCPMRVWSELIDWVVVVTDEERPLTLEVYVARKVLFFKECEC